MAHKTCQLCFRDQNLQAFLIGRQICVTVCMFVVARITTINVVVGQGNIFGVSDGLQNFFNTGLLGALITTIVASLAWRVVASSFPIAFLSNPLVYLIIRLCLILEKSGVCSAAWVLARYHKPLVNYQPDEVHLEGVEPHTSAPVTRRDKDIDRLVSVFKLLYSSALLIFALVIVMAALFTKQTVATAQLGVPSIAAFFIFWFLICWLAMMEGGQGALVGLQPIDKDRYEFSHPRTLKNTTIAHKGDNMERFIVGRQVRKPVCVLLCASHSTSGLGTVLHDLVDALLHCFAFDLGCRHRPSRLSRHLYCCVASHFDLGFRHRPLRLARLSYCCVVVAVSASQPNFGCLGTVVPSCRRPSTSTSLTLRFSSNSNLNSFWLFWSSS